MSILALSFAATQNCIEMFITLFFDTGAQLYTSKQISPEQLFLPPTNNFTSRVETLAERTIFPLLWLTTNPIMAILPNHSPSPYATQLLSTLSTPQTALISQIE